MSIILQSPESLSFSGNLKTFLISSAVEVTFVLHQGAMLILNEKYQPDPGNLVTVNVQPIIDQLIDVVIPASQQNIITEQTSGVSDFTAVIDGSSFEFRVVKGGVNELNEVPSDFMKRHFLTWQPQIKNTLTTQPEWLGIYTLSAGVIRLKAYYAENVSYTGTYATLAALKLYSINVTWGVVSGWLVAEGQSGQVIGWDVWYEVGAVQWTPAQRYVLRTREDQEHLYTWTNTLGGIDTLSFTGACEQDYKLVHKTALFEGNQIKEYDVENPREFRQSTGFLEQYEATWITDFFFSRKKYWIRPDGAVKRIAVTSSKILNTTQQDEVDYEFTYRLGEDVQLLNLENFNNDLPVPENLPAFFISELPLTGTTGILSVSINLSQDQDYPFVVGAKQPKLVQIFGGNGDLLGFNRKFEFGIHSIIIPGTDAQVAQVNILF